MGNGPTDAGSFGESIRFSNQYHDLNIEAHRAYPQQFQVPAATWHLSFWPDDEGHWLDAERKGKWWDKSLDRAGRRRAWIVQVNQLAKALGGELADQFVDVERERGQGHEDLADGKCDTRDPIILTAVGGCKAITGRVQVQSEHAAVTFFMDLMHPDLPEVAKTAWEAAQPILREEQEDGQPNHPGALEIQKLYEEVWGAVADIEGAQVPGLVFAQFRGLVLPARALGAESVVQDECFDDEKTPDFLWRKASLRSVLYARHGQSDDTDAIAEKHRETVACLAQRRRVLYVSSLGTRVAEGGHRDQRFDELDLRYLIVYSAEEEYRRQNPMQINRFVQRQHAMGRLRLLALRDYDRIRNISDLLHQYERELDVLIARQKNQPPRRSKLRDFRRKIDALNGEVVGSLPYRIWRSGYYFERFCRLLDAFEPTRLEGWQPYHEFMNRRMLQQVRHIQMVGKRAEGLRRRFDEYLGLVQVTRGVSWQILAGALAAYGVCLALMTNDLKETLWLQIGRWADSVGAPVSALLGHIWPWAG